MPTTGIPKGELIRLTIANEKVGHTTSSGISIQTATTETSSKDTGGGAWTETVAGKNSWTGSCEGLLSYDDTIGGEARLTYADMFAAQVARAPVAVKWGTGVTGDTDFSGNALITGLDFTAANDENGSYSFTLTGTGALTAAANA
jgi:predicted secreted protein